MRRAPELETAYPWGDEIKLNGEAMANCNGCGGEWGGKQTAPVDSFSANKFGLYQMVGNVWEWTEDCWNPSYQGAPADGSAWTNGECRTRVVRGGSWDDDSDYLRSAYPHQGPRGRAALLPGLPGRPDAYPLSLYLFTSWGPGAKPLVEFFGGWRDGGQLQTHRRSARSALSVPRLASADRREIPEKP